MEKDLIEKKVIEKTKLKERITSTRSVAELKGETGILLRDIIKRKNAKEQAEDYIQSIAEKTELIIFGCSSTGKGIYEQLREMNIEVSCFIDDVQSEYRDEYNGIPIIKTQKASELYVNKENVTIIIAVNYVFECERVNDKLIEHGFKQYLDKDLILYLRKQSIMKKCKLQDDLHLNEKQDEISIVFGKAECSITAKCTLRCKDCCQMVHLTQELGHSDVESTKLAIRGFSETIDYCTLLEVFGGEPLLCPNLLEILDEATRHSNILEVVVDTNGTLVPQDDVLELMRERGVSMLITDYGEKSSKKYEVLEACAKHNVPCTMKKVTVWEVYGDGSKSLNQENKEKFNTCVGAKSCSHVIEGRWYICFHCAHLTRLGRLTGNEGEYVDFTREDVAVSQNRKKMWELLNRKEPLSACVYCEGSGAHAMGGVQRK